MKRLWKIIKIILLSVVSLLVLIIMFLALTIPIAKRSEPYISNPGEKKDKWALTGVNALPMDSNYVLQAYTIFINGNTIESILPDSLADYDGYEKVSALGKYVTPGLIDMHAHAFDRTDLAQYLSHGVTTIRNMMGFPMHLRWKKQLEQNHIPGCRLITASPTLNADGEGAPFHKGVTSPQNAAELVEDYYNQGFDFIKVYDGITPEQLKAIVQTANRLGIQVAGHPPRGLTADSLAKAGLRTLEHVEEIFQGLLEYEFDEPKAKEIARIFKLNNVRVCVTLSAYHQIYLTVVEKQPFLDEQLKNPINPIAKFIGKMQMREYPTYSKEGYDWTVQKYAFMERLVQILDAEGVELIFGTDTGPSLTTPGKTVHEEFQLLKQTGLSNYSILRSATQGAANVLANETIGTLEVGKNAEFILTNENPLLDLSTLAEPIAIYAKETYYNQTAIAELRNLGENKQSWYTTLGNFLDHIIGK